MMVMLMVMLMMMMLMMIDTFTIINEGHVMLSQANGIFTLTVVSSLKVNLRDIPSNSDYDGDKDNDDDVERC